MTAHLRAKTAYSAPLQAAIRTPRSIEYDIFAQVTARLKQAGADPKTGFPVLAAALHDNRKLWTALAADVAEAGNSLPEALRAQLFYLAEFTNAHTRKILSGTETPEILVEINTSVMRGLSNAGLTT
ncbi:flagellar biosynthesis regulator FlaF [Actibacterium lipolyticum]|uniref:Flagellar biosynthesis regulatory protein FlaF n=1 Tax=Actibacterium lipolyticum TaxID=1524263 RepID=A0A238KXU0_9RHOB|nr:flagellar biosynthesis regulator FlaF [Actibacterium lipolyticum]SMX47460.1 flagellar biosynthesis regulatory protein FlaF [Actibacterium lipolyticum]